MKENCDWKKCLDRIEDKGFDDDDAYSEILEYIREVATVDEKREVLQNVEQRVKKIVNYDFAKAWFLRHMSESEHDVIEDLMGVRYVVLNEMMLHPTPAEVERFRYQNDKLFKLLRNVMPSAETCGALCFIRLIRWMIAIVMRWKECCVSSMEMTML